MHRCQSARQDVRALRASSALALAGLAVSILDLDQDQSRPLNEHIDGVEVHHIRIPDASKTVWFKPWLVVRMLRLLVLRIWLLLHSGADCYHALEVDAALACYVAGQLRRKPVIYEVYDLPLDNPYYDSYLRRRIYRAFKRHVMKMIAPTFAAIIATSPQHAQEFQRHYGGKTPIIVRNIPTFQRPVQSNHLHEWLKLPAKTRIALFQGYFQPNRSLDDLVRAARFIGPDIVIVLMGRGPCAVELQNLILSEGVSDRVRIVPFVPYDELLRWTASADIGLSLQSPDYSLNVEGMLPNKVFEYLMAGLPVLTSLPQVGRVLHQYDAGMMITFRDPQSFATAIIKMLDDRPGLERMRRNALAACERDLRWDVEQRHLLALYERVLGGQRQQPRRSLVCQ